jgi:GT2 family glycosyltransferase
MHNPLVSVIIVNWNGIRFLHNCLGSLSKIKYKNTEIIFVDNASIDDSVTYVKKNFPNIKILQNKENLGYAQGHEKAFKMTKGELILLLSTDTIVEINLLDELVKAIYSERNIGAVMPKLLMYPRKDLVDSIGSFFLDSGFLYHMGRQKDQLKPQYNISQEIFSAKGACILFKKSVLEKTGLFDKDYFAYFEDTDLCHRIWLSGNKVLYWPNTSVCHVGGGASKQMVPDFILFHSNKNRLCTYIKNLSPKYLIKVMPLILIIYQIAFIGYLVRGKLSAAWSFQRSIIWNLFNLESTLIKRKFVQNKIRKVSDDYFLPRVTRSVRLSYYYYLFSSEGLAKYYD